MVKRNWERINSKSTGDFIRWVSGDILKEETDVLIGNGLGMKNVSSSISNAAKVWYFNKLNTLI